MPRYFIEFTFKGTHYHGWQSQANARSVQGEMERALLMLTKEKIKTTGAGRTDTGVHARNYTAHFDTNNPLPAESNDFIYKMNAILPGDIAVRQVYQVKPDAHARYSALSRTYKYTISVIKDPFYSGYSWYYSIPLDVNEMNRAASVLMKYDDFKSFAKLHSDVKTHICHIYEARWERKESRLVFTICADRFLRNMVRAIVGTMVDIGRGKISVDNLHTIITGRNRNLAGFSVPAEGLVLYSIEYPRDIYD